MFVHNSTLSRFWVRYSVHDQCFSLYILPNIQFHINCNSLSLMERRVRIDLHYPPPLFFLHSLFVRVFSSHSRILYSFADVTYARHSWPLSSVGFLTCHTNALYWSSPRTLLPSLWQWSCHYFLTTLVFHDRGSNPDLPHAKALPLHHLGRRFCCCFIFLM